MVRRETSNVGEFFSEVHHKIPSSHFPPILHHHHHQQKQKYLGDCHTTCSISVECPNFGNLCWYGITNWVEGYPYNNNLLVLSYDSHIASCSLLLQQGLTSLSHLIPLSFSSKVVIGK